MENKKRTPILLKDGKNGANIYISKVNVLANEAKKLKQIFIEIATDNLDVEYSKEWIRKASQGNFKDAIGAALLKFIETHPKIMRRSIDEEFHRISAPLYAQAEVVKTKFENLYYESTASGIANPAEITVFDFLPINKDVDFEIDEDFRKLVQSKFEKYISTEKEFQVYDLVQEINTLKVKYPKVFTVNPLASWSQLLRDLKPIDNDFLNYLI